MQSKNTNTGSAQFNTNYSYLNGSDSSSVGVSYQASLPNIGWKAAVTDGGTAGTVGQGTKMEQFKISLAGALPGMRIKYQAHVSNVGWQDWVYDGAAVGVVGQQIEALKIQLEGAPEGYHVEYQAHVQDIGWQDAVIDGALAGTTGQVKRLEAIKVSIIKPDSKESTRIGSISNNGSSISYTYDKIGNIDTVTQDGKIIKYYYDELNELTREDNEVLNKTITYSYDVGGNITNKVEYPYTTGDLGTATKTVAYSYGDTNWKDKLTSFDGKSITYDQIGNPLTYNGFTYGWEMGRQLKSVSGNNLNIEYKYNDVGVRTEKTVNGVTTKYHLVGDKVTFEDDGTDKIYYTYDSSSNLVSMNINGVEYYYIRNAQGDVIGLFDGTGTQVVSYTYDSWGNVISTNGTLASNVGEKNPYRYRGYRYDVETGLYYLQSRYYNPEWGRFINADEFGGKVGDLLSHNIFAYCVNNPVNFQDPSGNWQILSDIWQGIKNIVNTVEQHILATVVTAVVVVSAVVAINYVIRNPRALPVATTSSTAITKYDPKFAAQQLVRGGKTTTNALKSMVPKGSINQFKPSSTISNGYKYVNKINGTKVEIKWHAPDLNAAEKFGNMSNSGSGWTAQIKIGNKLLGQDLNFYKKARDITDIPLFGGGE